jgi:hypothetical protein
LACSECLVFMPRTLQAARDGKVIASVKNA